MDAGVARVPPGGRLESWRKVAAVFRTKPESVTPVTDCARRPSVLGRSPVQENNLGESVEREGIQRQGSQLVRAVQDLDFGRLAGRTDGDEERH
ncbi:hypothetical protein GCM10027159_00410 [Lysobacter terrae]